MNTVSWIVLASLALAACEGGGLSPREASRAGSGLDLSAPAGDRAVERDVPAPQVFDVTESGLWDGRPSLGGVWVAHPTAQDPERVIIRNTQTGAEVIGALFRRERENPGPRFQISSEAAGALGILAGQPATLQVIALRMERVEPRAATPTAARSVAPADGDSAETAAPLSEAAETAAAAATTTQATTAEAVEAPAPRRLRDIFRRQDSQPTPPPADPGETALAPVAPIAAAPSPVVAATPMPTTEPQGSVEIIALDPEPAAPRRGLRDIFRRSEPAPQGDTTISQTALAPAAPLANAAPVVTMPIPLVAAAPVALGAPLAATTLLTGPSDERSASRPVRPAPMGEPALITPDAQAEAPRERRSLRDVFRRQPEAGIAPAVADATLIPLPEPAAAVVPARAAPTPASAPAATSLRPDRPFVQAAIFSQEDNAIRARATLRSAGLPAEIRSGRAGERDFWRVVVGPAADAATQADHIRRARDAGFVDAYAVAR